MCWYDIAKYRCGHTFKNPAPGCDNYPDCIDDNARLLEFRRDISITRKCIRDYRTDDRDNANYTYRIDQLKADYKDFFGRGSGNVNRTIDSLEQLEEYLDGEIGAICRNTNPVVRIDAFCEDGCWQSVQIQAREDQERRERESAEGARRERERRAELRRWERGEREEYPRSGGGYDGNGGYGGPPPPYQRY